MARAPSAIRNQPHDNGISFDWKTRGTGTSRALSVPMAEEGVPRLVPGTTRLPTPAPAPRGDLWMTGRSNSS